MKRFFIVLILMVVLSTSLVAQHSDWQIRMGEGGRIEDAVLLGLDNDSLVVSSPAFNGKILVRGIERLRRGSSHATVGAVTGLLVGGGVGYFLGNKQDDALGPLSDKNKTMEAVLIGGGAGVLLGGIAGSASGRETYRLDGKTLAEKVAILEPILLREGRTSTPVDTLRRDAVYLKNGSIVRGTVVELVPDSVVKVLTADSSVFVFAKTEVSQIAKESIPRRAFPVGVQDKRSGTPSSDEVGERRVRFMLSAGMGFPAGVFGEKSGSTAGGATSGFALGADVAYKTRSGIEWLTSLYLSFQPFDESALQLAPGVQVDAGSWTLIWPMTGVRVSSNTSQDVSLFVLGQVGVLIGSSPEITATIQNMSISQPSSNANSVAFDLGCGIVYQQRYMMSLRYLYGSPEYKYQASGGGYSVAGKAEQATSVIFLGVGFVF